MRRVAQVLVLLLFIRYLLRLRGPLRNGKTDLRTLLLHAVGASTQLYISPTDKRMLSIKGHSSLLTSPTYLPTPWASNSWVNVIWFLLKSWYASSLPLQT